jgi:hypothetical protein|tara:strand:+ start:561 stop:752 length:192 start_codon:yes stop_codon:yes gene_type:complete
MKTDNIVKIDCTTITTYRNTKTGKTSNEKLEGPDIVTDVTVQVSPKGLDLMQKVMNENKKPKS